MEQTAVEFLIENLIFINSKNWDSIVEQAKEMEKQQKLKYLYSILDCINLLKQVNKTDTIGQTVINIRIIQLENMLKSDQYYNETFNKRKIPNIKDEFLAKIK